MTFWSVGQSDQILCSLITMPHFSLFFFLLFQTSEIPVSTSFLQIDGGNCSRLILVLLLDLAKIPLSFWTLINSKCMCLACLSPWSQKRVTVLMQPCLLLDTLQVAQAHCIQNRYILQDGFNPPFSKWGHHPCCARVNPRDYTPLSSSPSTVHQKRCLFSPYVLFILIIWEFHIMHSKHIPPTTTLLPLCSPQRKRVHQVQFVLSMDSLAHGQAPSS